MNWMKIIIVVSVILVCSVSYAAAYTPKELQMGERYVYTVKWIGIPVGRIKAVIEGETIISGQEVFIIQCYVQTNRFMSMIYKIDDRFISYVDKEKLVPLKLEVSRREGFYKKDAVTIFDHKQKKAYFYNYLDKSNKEYDIPPDIQDIVSIFYRLRHNELVLDEEHHYDVAFAESIFSVFGSIDKQKTIKLPTGKRTPVYYTEPYAKKGNEAVTHGTMSAYISSDEYQIPYRVVLKAPLFTKVTATLTEAHALQS